jgi:nicotinamide mononucleotide transporter
MQPLLDFLYQTAFTLGGTPVSIVEIAGFILGIATVWLVAKNNILTFPVGIVQAGLFFILFLEAKLFADMWLQVFFIVIQFGGWYAWLKAGPNRTKLVIAESPRWLLGACAAGIAVFTVLMIPVLREAHGAYPGPDAASTGLSVAAQFLMTWKFIENWYLWIIADLIYIPIYFAKDLYFTGILYVIFLGICIMGLLHWRKVRDGQAEALVPNSANTVAVAVPEPAIAEAKIA